MNILEKTILGLWIAFVAFIIFYKPIDFLIKIYTCHKLRYHTSCKCSGDPNNCNLNCLKEADMGNVIAEEIITASFQWKIVGHSITNMICTAVSVACCIAFL